METEDYQARLKALGIARGKLETGFVDPEIPSTVTSRHEPSNDGKMTVQPTPSPPPKVSEKQSTIPDRKVVNNSVNKCRCGAIIKSRSTRCRKCFRLEMQATWNAAQKGISLPVQPSPPPALPPPAVVKPHLVETYRLYLGHDMNRSVVVVAPVVITAQELKRIQSWIGLQLIIEDPTEWDYVI